MSVLVSKLSSLSGVKKQEVQLVLDALADLVNTTLSQPNEKLTIPNVATFSNRVKPATPEGTAFGGKVKVAAKPERILREVRLVGLARGAK